MNRMKHEDGERGQAAVEAILVFALILIPLAFLFLVTSEAQIHDHFTREAARFAAWEWAVPDAEYSDREMNLMLDEQFGVRGEFRVAAFENTGIFEEDDHDNPFGVEVGSNLPVTGMLKKPLAWVIRWVGLNDKGLVRYRIEHSYEPFAPFYLKGLIPDGGKLTLARNYALQTDGWAVEAEHDKVWNRVSRIQYLGLNPENAMIGAAHGMFTALGFPLTPLNLDIPKE